MEFSLLHHWISSCNFNYTFSHFMLKIKNGFIEIFLILRINRFTLINVQTFNNTEKSITNLLNISDKNYRFFSEAGSFSSRRAVLETPKFPFNFFFSVSRPICCLGVVLNNEIGRRTYMLCVWKGNYRDCLVVHLL